MGALPKLPIAYDAPAPATNADRSSTTVDKPVMNTHSRIFIAGHRGMVGDGGLAATADWSRDSLGLDQRDAL